MKKLIDNIMFSIVVLGVILITIVSIILFINVPFILADSTATPITLRIIGGAMWLLIVLVLIIQFIGYTVRNHKSH